MAQYLKYLILSLIIFSIMYWGLTYTVGHNIGQAPSTSAISFVYVIGLLSWVISAYIFASLNKKLGFLNGLFFGLCTLPIIVAGYTPYISSGTIDVITVIIPFTLIGVVLGALGGGIYDVQQFVKHKNL